MLVIEFPTQRKYEEVAKLDEQDVVLNDLPLQMIVLVDVPKTRAKDTESKKDKPVKGKSEKKSLNINLVQISDSETNDERLVEREFL